jgi:hypothetical protein
MWKENITKESAINIIKNKRKCTEINLGFLFQLSKWEEFINLKENKFFTFNNNYNISLLGINDLIDVFFNEKIFVILVLHNNKLYKIYNGAFITSNFIEEKINNFINFLIIHNDYQNNIESFVCDKKLLLEENFKIKSKILLENNLLEEIIKYFQSF